MTTPTPTALRIGHAERELAVKALDDHLTAGRLDAEEYGERMAQASVARTRDELTALFTDLPAPHPFFAAPPPPPVVGEPVWAPALRQLNRRGGAPFAVRAAAAFVTAVVAIVATVFFVGGWVLFMVLPWIFGGGHHNRRAPWGNCHNRSRRF